MSVCVDRAIYAHHCCAAWNDGVLQAEDYSLQYVDKFAFNGLSSVSQGQARICSCSVNILTTNL